MARHLVRRAGVVGLVLACPIALVAQKRPPAGSVVDSVKVNIVNVELYVTDRAGRAVPGLTAADFELFEDGKRVEITNFYVGDGFARAVGEAMAEGEERPSPEQAPPPADEAQALHLVVLVDSLNITNASRKVALEAVANAVESRLRPGDDVMVAAFDRILRILCPLTADIEKAAAALRKISRASSEGQFFKSDHINMLDRLQWMSQSSAGAGGAAGGSKGQAASPGEQAGADAIRDAELFEATSTAQRLFDLEQALLANVGQLVDSLAGLPGRKALVFVSEGIPRQVNRAQFTELEARFPGQALSETERTRFNLHDRFRALGMRANAGRVTFYPVDAKLYRGPGFDDAQRASLLADPSAAGVAELEAGLSLMDFAEATGGEVLTSTASLEERFGNVIEELDAFYSLGYAPSHNGDGEYHRLDVKVKCEGLKLRYREGYLDKTEAERQADRTAAALLRSGYTNRLGVEADTGPAVRDKGKTLKVPLTVSLPGSAVTLLPAEKGMSGKVSFSIAGADSSGHQSEVHREEFTIPVPEEQLETMRRQRVVFTFDVLVREGETKLAITARDEIGRVESTVTLGITAEPSRQ